MYAIMILLLKSTSYACMSLSPCPSLLSPGPSPIEFSSACPMNLTALFFSTASASLTMVSGGMQPVDSTVKMKWSAVRFGHFVTPAFQSDTFTTHGAVTWVLDNSYSGVSTTTATTAATTSRSFFRHTTSSAQVFYIEHTHRTHCLELICFIVSDRLQQSDVGHEAVRRRSYWTELGMILAEPLARVSFELNALSGGQLGQHDVVVHGSDGLLAPILLMTLGLPHEVFG